MARVKVKTLLKSNTEVFHFSGIGILCNDKLTFMEDKVRVIVQFQKKNDIFIKRETDTYTISIFLQKELTKAGIYDIKCDSMQIELATTAQDICIEDGHICLMYNLVLGGHNQGDFTYDIWYEVIE